MLPRLRASPRHGGAINILANSFFVLSLVINPPRGALRGGGTYPIWGYGGLNPHHNYWEKTFFIIRFFLTPQSVQILLRKKIQRIERKKNYRLLYCPAGDFRYSPK